MPSSGKWPSICSGERKSLGQCKYRERLLSAL
jgi:hypothetical protein